MPRRRKADEPPEPLGSVTQPLLGLVPGTGTCRTCGNDRLTRIRMALPSGVPAVYVSCPRCETTGWFAVDGDGTPLDPGSALGPSAPG
ncbi:hypothetical protein [Cellulomonas marina]|uniref:Uncharacterized protein n=1 Tax=Cellulomonas marina TaxID=988821 RepID=A0A1I0UZM6_9CELL|nr:hypothetical protein [Cellulomonas marina]GIG29890.1 hypothetical protein Cma02nite_24900 [Cellulomonas marina]SFA69508.1 hypothetical protein SAMN05421867_10147 [Cellulomonas marina]